MYERMLGPPAALSGNGDSPPAPSGYPQMTTSTSFAPEGRHLLDYVRILYKRRRVAFAVLVAVVAIVAWVTFRAEPLYEARTQLLIEPESRSIVLFKDSIEQEDADDEYQQTQYRILQSRNLAQRTLGQLQLWDHPELAMADANQGAIGWLQRTAAPVLRLVGMAPTQAATSTSTTASAGGAAPVDSAGRGRAVDVFLSRLTVTPVRNSRLVDVKVQAKDPELAARLVNALAQNYMDQNLETKVGTSKQASDWLAEQLEEQRKKVEASEVALQRYRERNDALSLDEPNNIVLQKLTDLNSAVTRAKTQRIEREAVYRAAASAGSNPAVLDSVPAIMSSTYVQALRTDLSELQQQRLQLSERLGERHPEMVKLNSALGLAEARLKDEVQKVVLSLESEYKSALAQEQSLVGALDTQKNEALALNRKGIDYGALQREATSNRQIFETLLQRARETGISGEMKSNNIQIVDAADVPQTPVWPRKGRNMLFGLLGGLALAVTLAFFTDYLDNRIKSPEELRHHLGLPFLGLIPSVPAKYQQGVSPLLTTSVPAKFSEAVRALRTNVLLSAGEDGPRSLMVTSTGPKEGKTVLSCNLAIALAQAGQRVLLVDADLRRPRVHQLFDVPQDPGLSNLLVGSAGAGDTFRQTSVEGLWLLPAGTTPTNPADLLGSPRFRHALQTTMQHFHWVIIDSPPVLAVTDASVIAHLASGVLFVVGADRTSRHAAQAALEQLEAARAPLIGGILNSVDLERNPYYFAKYYRAEYGEYYAAQTPA